MAAWSSWGAVAEVFDPAHPEAEQVRESLEDLFGPEAVDAAAATTLNAHYTDPAVAKAMWEALATAGFSGGPVLEPGCGAGVFIGLAPESAQMIGVELDPVTASIASRLQPQARIEAGGFQNTRIPEGSLNAVIGNVPFGDFVVHDPLHNTARLSIHNHFIAKSLRLTAPGGYVAVITSTFTLDAAGEVARRQIGKYGDLVAAVRLPQGAFKETAGTDVSADVLVFRRRENGATASPEQLQTWVQREGTAVERADTEDTEVVRINRWFVDHPEAVLGQMRITSGRFGDEVTVQPVQDRDLAQSVRQELERQLGVAAENGLGYAPYEPTAVVDTAPGLHTLVSNGNGRIGTVRAREEGTGFEQLTPTGWAPVTVKKANHVEARALLKVRDAAVDLMAVQRRPEATSAERDAARQALNLAYDVYVSAYGPINRFTLQRSNIGAKALALMVGEKEAQWRASLPQDGEIEPSQVEVAEELLAEWGQEVRDEQPLTKRREHLTFLRQDPSRGLLMSLENFDEQEQTASKRPLFSADIRTKTGGGRTAESPADAVAIALDENRVLSLDRIAELLDVDPALARDALGDLVFDDPETGELVPRQAYLAGNVRQKLDVARQKAETDTRFQVNVTALEAVIPAPVSAGEVVIKPGGRYIEAGTYEQYVSERFGVLATIRLNTEDSWEVKTSGAQFSPSVRYQFGTGDRTPTQLLESIMNSRSVVVRRAVTNPDGSKRYVKDAKATVEARDKAARIADDFGAWVLSEPGRAETVMARYNEMFNSVIRADYTGMGEVMALPGLNDAITPRPYQRAAVARILAEPTTLLDHVVGAGKTGTMCMAAMELRRTGIATKPAIIVPNHLVDQVAAEFTSWYPMAEVLAIPTGLNAADRQAWIAAAGMGEWDAVIMPQTVFTSIQIDPVRSAEWLREEIEAVKAANAEADPSDKVTQKRLQRQIKVLEERHAKTLAGKDQGLVWEDTGIDYLFVDEAHLFKNLFRASDSYELACTGSLRAQDLDYKLRALREHKIEQAKADGRYSSTFLPAVATFATGTPVANSIAEWWVMQHYLRPDLLAGAGVADVNAWAGQFTERSTILRISPAGGGFDQVEKITTYINLPELQALSDPFTDTVTTQDLGIVLPDLKGGERHLLKREPSEEVRDYVVELGARAKRLGSVDPREDNMPKITGDGRMVALDPRLRGLPADPDGGRAAQVAEQIQRIDAENSHIVYQGVGEPTGSLQIVFCDRATPNLEGRFSMYDEIRSQCVSLGMEESTIRFIHEARSDEERQDLFRACRAGQVRVLIGSTEKMGTGTNVQDRVVAIHHVDVPFRPDYLEQREGRGLRHGNQNAEVEVLIYAVSETFDVYMWDLVAHKAGFINTLKHSKGVRKLEDGFGDLELTASQAAAALSGDPRLEQLATLQMQAAKLETLQGSWADGTRRAKIDRGLAEAKLSVLDTQVPLLERARHQARPTEGELFNATVGAVPFTNRVEAGKALLGILHRAVQVPNAVGPWSTETASVGGLEVSVRATSRGYELRLGGTDALMLSIDAKQLRETTARGLMQRVENLLAAIPERLTKATLSRPTIEADREQHAQRENTPFDRAEELLNIQQQIRDLMDDMGLQRAEEEAEPVQAEVEHEVLQEIFGDSKARGRELRVGDVVTKVPGQGSKFFTVTSTQHGRVELSGVTATDGPENRAEVAGYEAVELISRRLDSLNEFEQQLVAAAKDPQKSLETMHSVTQGQLITVHAPEIRNGSVARYGDPEVTITGTVTALTGNTLTITSGDGSEHRVPRHFSALPNVLVHAPKKVDAQGPSTVLLPGDVLIEDTQAARRGDVLRLGRHGSYWADPETGAYRQAGSRGQVRPGRYLTTEEVEKVWTGDGLGADIGSLRPGDLVSEHELNPRAASRERVSIVSVSNQTMSGIRYLDPQGEVRDVKRRQDQTLTIHARRYGALSLAETARLAEPGVTTTRVQNLPEALGQWVAVLGSRGNSRRWGEQHLGLGRLQDIKVSDSHAMLRLQTVDGIEEFTAVLYDDAVIWPGELPEQPLDLVGMEPEANAITPKTPRQAEEPERPRFLPEEATSGTEDFPRLSPTRIEDPVPPAPAAAQPGKGSAVGRVLHSAEGTSVEDVERGQERLIELLKSNSFKYSARQQLWYLPRPWKEATRASKVRQLLRGAGQAGIVLDRASIDGKLPTAVVQQGDWVRISPDEVHIRQADWHGATPLTQFPAFYARVESSGAGRGVHCEVKTHGVLRSFEVTPIAGGLTAATQQEVLAWAASTGADVSQVEELLDTRVGRRVQDVPVGSRITGTVTPVTLGNQRRVSAANAVVAATTPGRSGAERFLLLKEKGRLQWVAARNMDAVLVTGTGPAPAVHATPPVFREVPVTELALGTRIHAQGIQAETASSFIKTIGDATGNLTHRAQTETGLEIHVDTGQGVVRLQERFNDGFRVTTMTEGRAEEVPNPGHSPEWEHGLETVTSPASGPEPS